jgi:proton-coupled amino acid transporter
MGTGVDSILIFMQCGFCVVYVVFLANTVSSTLSPSSPESARPNALLILYPLLVALSWIRTLSSMSWVSMVANLAMLFGLSIITFASVRKLNSEQDHATLDTEPQWGTLPIMFGIIVYAFEGIGNVLPCETSMSEPQKMPRVLYVAAILTVIIYLVFGSVAYAAFGRETGNEDGMVTANVYEYVDSEHWTGAVRSLFFPTLKLLLAFNLLLTFPLQLFVVTDLIEDYIFRRLMPQKAYQAVSSSDQTELMSASPRFDLIYWQQNGLRAVLVAVICLLAYSVPNFGALVGLIGSLGGSSLQFIIPALCYMKLFWNELSAFWVCVFVLYMSIGIVGGFVGFVQSLAELIG